MSMIKGAHALRLISRTGKRKGRSEEFATGRHPADLGDKSPQQDPAAEPRWGSGSYAPLPREEAGDKCDACGLYTLQQHKKNTKTINFSLILPVY